MTAAGAVRYVLVGDLPLHVLAAYILAAENQTDFFTLLSVPVIMLFLHTLWRMPVLFVRNGRHIAEWLSDCDILLTDEEKALRRYETRGFYRLYYKATSSWLYIIFPVLVFVSGFVVLQILRVPPVDAAYVRALYAVREPVWENNAYIALHGMNAPVDEADWYGHGRWLVYREYKAWEHMKRRAGLMDAKDGSHAESYTSSMEIMTLIPRDEDEWKNLGCLYDLRAKYENCASGRDVKTYIRAYPELWARFNTIPDYPVYKAVPQLEGARAQNIIHLAQLKAADIVLQADGGTPEAAWREWKRFMPLYRRMVEEPDSAVFRAVSAIALGIHVMALEVVLNRHPALAVAHADEIIALLVVEGDALGAETLLADDVVLVEPLVLPYTGNVNAMRNGLYDCLAAFETMARRPLHELPFDDYKLSCGPADESFGELTMESLYKPGFFISNLIYEIPISGLVAGARLFPSARLQDVKMRMMALGVTMMRDGVTAQDVPAYLAAAPERFQNPITRAPFLWDAQTKELYFETSPPSGPDRRFFRLPL